MKNELRPFMAGFDLGGWKNNKTEKIVPVGRGLDPDTTSQGLSEWPREIDLFGRTYTLEDVRDESTRGEWTFQNAIYV